MDSVCLECRGCLIAPDDTDCARCNGSGIEPLHPDLADREARFHTEMGEYICLKRDRKAS